MDKVSIFCIYVLLICKYLDFFKITMFFKKNSTQGWLWKWCITRAVISIPKTPFMSVLEEYNKLL